MPSHRPLRVKFILPALTEATSPYWRPIKYSLFPPLGLATLAAYLNPDDEAEIVDEHVGPLDCDDRPDLVAIQVYITNAQPRLRARRRVSRQRRVRGPRRPARDVAARTKRPRTPTRSSSARASRPSRSFSPTSGPARRSTPLCLHGGPHARTCAADPPRPDPPPLVSRAQLDRRHARLPAAL